ncbi:MAG: hypothetical protein ABR886_12500, partial [Dehalococcoidales bacterium]
KLIQYPDYLLFGEALPFQVFPPWPILAFHLTIGTIFGEQVITPLFIIVTTTTRVACGCFDEYALYNN